MGSAAVRPPRPAARVERERLSSAEDAAPTKSVWGGREDGEAEGRPRAREDEVGFDPDLEPLHREGRDRERALSPARVHALSAVPFFLVRNPTQYSHRRHGR